MPPTALAELADAHRAFVAECRPWSHNRTLYFDTEGMALYLRHHAGARDRYKVQTRAYVDSHLAYLEVKHKVGVNRTVKSRMKVAEPTNQLSGGCLPSFRCFDIVPAPYRPAR